MPNENLQTDLKQDWYDREIVMPVHVNDWSSRINKINEIIPTYSATGSFYKCSFEDNTYKLSPMVFADDSQNVAPTSYIDGMQVEFKIAETNETNCLVDVNGLGAKTIKNTDNTVVEAETLEKNDYVTLRYDYEQDCFYIVTSASKQSGAALPMFSHFWSDHIYNDVSYLRADTFSWHYAYIYRTGFQILEEEYNHEDCVLETENGITYKLSPNGFKIADVSQQDKIRSLYENTGSAWYYIIDTKNRCFKLPREKSEWELKGTAHVDVAGNGMALGFTNGTVNFAMDGQGSSGHPNLMRNEYGLNVGQMSGSPSGSINGAMGLTPDPTKSGIGGTVKLSNTIERKNTDRRKYLYFYVGQSKRPETEVNLGETSETLNNKVDLDAENYKGSELEEYVNDTCLNDKRTNCLTKIPQRIKLELVDGTLTLKTGSQVIVPYGTSAPTMQIGDTLNGGRIVDISWDGAELFYIVQYDTDLTTKQTTTAMNSQLGVLIDHRGYLVALWFKTNIKYDTTTNIVNENYSSLPFAICTQTSGVTTSIDQTFNGMGYIGSTIWVDKGVKGLIPNGRNEDGSLKNIELVTTNVKIRTITYAYDEYFVIRPDGSLAELRKTDCFIQEETPNITQGQWQRWFNIRENYWYYHDNTQTTWVKTETDTHKFAIISSNIRGANGTITSFQPKQPFRAVDYSDSSTVSGWAMPSQRYIDLTLGANLTTYIAPANGYFYLAKVTSSNQTLSLLRKNIGSNYYEDLSVMLNGPSNGNAMSAVFLPVKKGDTVQVSYNATGATQAFKFIYAEGEV